MNKGVSVIMKAAAGAADIVCAALFFRGRRKPLGCLLALRGVQWLMFGHRVGKLSHMSVPESLIKTLLLGAAWWLPQNEKRHQEIESEVDQTRFKDKACGIRLAGEE